jgi:tetratricopeptide (TPR) repeat protein
MLLNKMKFGFIIWLMATTAFSANAEEQEDPVSFNEHIANANELAKLKLYDRALTELEAAIKQNPEAPRVYKVRGNVYFAMGDYKKALSDFDQLITLAPSSADSYVYHSIVNSALENYQRAKEDIDHALDLSPKSKSVKEARDKILRRINSMQQEN